MKYGACKKHEPATPRFRDGRLGAINCNKLEEISAPTSRSIDTIDCCKQSRHPTSRSSAALPSAGIRIGVTRLVLSKFESPHSVLRILLWPAAIMWDQHLRLDGVSWKRRVAHVPSSIRMRRNGLPRDGNAPSSGTPILPLEP